MLTGTFDPGVGGEVHTISQDRGGIGGTNGISPLLLPGERRFLTYTIVRSRDGSAKSFLHSHSHFCPSPSHCIRISHSHCIFHTFFAFSHFFDLFSPFFTVSTPKFSKKCEKMWENCEKVRKMRKSAKCECDAKMESKFAPHYNRNFFSHFRTFLHRICIALPSLVRSSNPVFSKQISTWLNITKPPLHNFTSKSDRTLKTILQDDQVLRKGYNDVDCTDDNGRNSSSMNTSIGAVARVQTVGSTRERPTLH